MEEGKREMTKRSKLSSIHIIIMFNFANKGVGELFRYKLLANFATSGPDDVPRFGTSRSKRGAIDTRFEPFVSTRGMNVRRAMTTKGYSIFSAITKPTFHTNRQDYFLPSIAETHSVL